MTKNRTFNAVLLLGSMAMVLLLYHHPAFAEIKVNKVQVLSLSDLVISPMEEPLYHALSAELAVLYQQPSLALIHYLSLARLAPHERWMARAFRHAIAHKAYTVALQLAEHRKKLLPDDPRVGFSLVSLYLMEEHLKKAHNQLDHLIQSIDPNESLEYMLLLVDALKTPGQLHQLAGIADTLSQSHPDDPSYFLIAAYVQYENQQLMNALKKIRRALALKAYWSTAEALRAQILWDLSKPEQALKNLKCALDNNSEDTKLRLFYAQILMDSKQFALAKQQYTQLHQQKAYPGEALLSLSNIALLENDVVSAKKYLKQGLAFPRFINQARYLLGQVYEGQKQWDEAIAWYDAITQGPYYFSGHLKAVLLSTVHQHVQSARQILHTIQANSWQEQHELSLLETDLLINAGNYQQAMEVLDKSLWLMPGNKVLLYARAHVASQMDQLEQSEKDLKEILEQDPNHIPALNVLSFILSDKNKRYQEALLYSQRAYKLAPDNPNTLDSLGWVYYRLGFNEKALKHLRKAYTLVQSQLVSAHLGEVLWVVGQKQQAREIWDEALSLAPNSLLIHATMKRLTGTQ